MLSQAGRLGKAPRGDTFSLYSALLDSELIREAIRAILRRNRGEVAGLLVRVLIAVGIHCSSSDLGNEGLDNLRDILQRKLWSL